mgnify:CR=1 FL=1
MQRNKKRREKKNPLKNKKNTTSQETKKPLNDQLLSPRISRYNITKKAKKSSHIDSEIKKESKNQKYQNTA